MLVQKRKEKIQQENSTVDQFETNRRRDRMSASNVSRFYRENVGEIKKTFFLIVCRSD